MTSNAAAYATLLEVERPRQRLAWVDGLRGLCIAAMVVSHVGLVTGLTPSWFHTVAMRPFAPLFLILFGYLWRPGWRRRHWQLVGACLIAQPLAWTLGFATPNILVVILLAVGVMHLYERWPVGVVIASVTQLVFWPMPDWWTGYPLGFVALCAVAGRYLPDRELSTVGEAGERAGLSAIGRHPLAWYLGHLVVLATAVAVLT